MKVPSFLIDENLPPIIAGQIQRHEPQIQALAVGQPGAPAKSTLDPELLRWIEENDYLLVTNNRASIPGHLRDHLAAGRHVPGILVVSFPLDIGELIEELILIWGASLPDEYRDRIVYLPLTR
jgi:hypothetical protein